MNVTGTDWAKQPLYHCTRCRWLGRICSTVHEKTCPQCGRQSLRDGARSRRRKAAQPGATPTRKLTPKMKNAMTWTERNGFIFAGENVYRGRLFRFAASTLRALQRRGLLRLALSPDGGMIGYPVAAAATADDATEPNTPVRKDER